MSMAASYVVCIWSKGDSYKVESYEAIRSLLDDIIVMNHLSKTPQPFSELRKEMQTDEGLELYRVVFAVGDSQCDRYESEFHQEVHQLSAALVA